jgi:hypothetical protein
MAGKPIQKRHNADCNLIKSLSLAVKIFYDNILFSRTRCNTNQYVRILPLQKEINAHIKNMYACIAQCAVPSISLSVIGNLISMISETPSENRFVIYSTQFTM